MNRSQPLPTPEEMIAEGLNQQGFLLAQKVRDEIELGLASVSAKGWKCLAHEYSVTAADTSQTRIDLVLQQKQNSGHIICAECKRANPLYKRWAFFDRDKGQSGDSNTRIFFESFQASTRPLTKKHDANHGILSPPCPPSCPVFNLYIEIAINREKLASSTTTIEDAFRQVVRGQSGYVARQIKLQDVFRVVAFPVVITTAVLSEVNYETSKIPLGTGTIQPTELQLQPLKFCAVNYHADDALAVSSDFAYPITSTRDDIFYKQTRTVFVVQSEFITEFLLWMDDNVAR